MDEKPVDNSGEHATLAKKSIVKHLKKAQKGAQRHAKRFVVRRVDNVRAVGRTVVVWLVASGVVIAGIAGQGYLSSLGYSQQAPASGGTYAEAVQGELTTLNPLYATSEPELSAVRLMFSSLYDYDATGALRGDLATGLSVDQSGKIYTVKLRAGASWHDGVALTAKDVAFTVNLIKNPATRSPLYNSWHDVSVKVLDDKTVEFTLQAPFAPFRQSLTFAVLPEHLLAKVGASTLRENSYSQAPVGSGPFKFQLLQTDDVAAGRKVLYLEANQSYYRGAPRLSRFELHNYESAASLGDALVAGKINGASEVVDAKLTTGMSMHQAAINRGAYAFFNLKNEILSQPEVRQALQMATNTKDLTADIGNGTLSLDLPFVAGQLVGDDAPKRSAYNLEEAKKLLDKSGWVLKGNVREKNGKKLTLTITTTKNALYEKTVAALTNQWKQLGVDAQTRIIDDNAAGMSFASDILQPRAYDVLVRELSIGADMDVYAYWHSSQNVASGLNLSGYQNILADDYLAAARSRSDSALRMVKYKAFTRQWLADVPAVGLYQPSLEYVTRGSAQSVTDGAVLPSAVDRYSNVIDWTVERQSVYKTS